MSGSLDSAVEDGLEYLVKGLEFQTLFVSEQGPDDGPRSYELGGRAWTRRDGVWRAWNPDPKSKLGKRYAKHLRSM